MSPEDHRPENHRPQDHRSENHRPDADDRPRYRRIADLLRQRIETGAYPVGSQLPTESDLCESFAISRHTAREALRRLAEAGLIQRRQGSGSLVIATAPAQVYVHSMRSLNELFEYATDTMLRFSSVGLALPGVDHHADIGPASGQDWLRAEGLRLDPAGRLPISSVTIFVNRDFAAIAADLPSIRGAIYRQIEDRFGVEVAEVEQVIRMEPLPPAAAAALGLRPRTTAARITRRYLDADGRALIVSVNWHPADRFSYSMRLRREGPKGGWT